MGLSKRNTPISGCSVYLMKNGVQIPGVSCKDDVTVSLPSIEFENFEIDLMGKRSVPNYSRVNSMELTLNMHMDDDVARQLAVPGLQEWKIVWFDYQVDQFTDLQMPVYWEVYVKGYIMSIPNAEVSVGGENRGDITMNVLSISKKRQGVSIPNDPGEYTIDCFTNTIRMAGKDYAAPSKKLMVSI